MKRRVLLQAATAGAAGLLAGCLDGGTPDGSGTPTDDGSPTSTDDDTAGGTGGDATGNATDSTDAETDGEGTAEPTDDDSGDSTDDGSTGDGTSDEGTGQGEDTPTDTDDGSSSGSGSGGSSSVVDRSFEVGGAECGQGEQQAEVTRGEARVDVDGTIRGRNGCYTAELEDVTYDDRADELTIAVRASEGDGEYCQQCIVDIDYRASVEFEDGTPGTVRVRHDGEQVTTA